MISVHSVHVRPKLLLHYLPEASENLTSVEKQEQVQDKTKTSSQVWNRPEGTRKTDNRKESVAKRQSSSDSDVRKREIQGRYIHPLDETNKPAKLKGESFSDVSS